MEEFKSLPQYPGYLIGNQGSIISKRFNRPLAYKTNKNGYHCVCLSIDTKHYHLSVHRLIGIAWISNPENKSQIDHINRIRTDNRISNLRWATSEENCNNKTPSVLPSSRNKSGVRGLNYDTRWDLWYVNKSIDGVRQRKGFKKREDALAFLESLTSHSQ